MRRLYPGVKVAIGPPIENGFYYDFDFPEPITEADLSRSRPRCGASSKEGRSWERRGDLARRGAGSASSRRTSRTRSSSSTPPRATSRLYTQGDFTDLCRGPHLQNSKPIKAFKLTGLAGAYWRGDENNKQLTRIYGTAFYAQADLDAHLERLEEARKRDHRRLGTQLDLFHLEEISPGSPFWHPKGMVIWNELEDLRRRENARRGYVEVKTPLIYDKALWETLGPLGEVPREHVPDPGGRPDLRDQADELPGAHAALRATRLRSYRELPLRYAEAAPLHRNERAGTLHGLTRVRHVTQDDAHIFCTREQIEDEIFGCLDYAEVPLRPLRARGALRALDPAGQQARHRGGVGLHRGGARRPRSTAAGSSTTLNPGDGAFYGPKIDLHMTDSLGRSWQMGTIQLDSQQPERLNCRYVGADNAEHTPYVVHRALFGSFERFIGILTEHYGGAFPFWLAPVQVRVIPVGEQHRDAAHGLVAGARAGYRVEVDDSGETVGKRIRERRGREDPVRRRLRRQGERREPGDPGAGRGAEHPLAGRFPGETCYPGALASRGGTVSHLLAHASGVQPMLNRAG